MIEITPKWEDYELIDCGNGKKFERFGKYTFIRPDAQAIWSSQNGNWQADAEFIGEEAGHWKFNKQISKRWEMGYKDIKFWAEPTPFRHFGVFPETASQWEWMTAQNPKKVLNLFGYTGLASLILAKNGSAVTHVDASKKSVNWARENQELSKLTNAPIRWIVDDALKFVEREIKRESKYDAIILDPPKYGRGPTGEIWKIEESLPELLQKCKQILTSDAKFITLTSYALRLSAISLNNLLVEIFGDKVTSGELATKDRNNRILPNAIFARWQNSRLYRQAKVKS